MIMDLLGPNLQDLLMLCGGKFSVKTSILLTVQIVKEYSYLDLKIRNTTHPGIYLQRH
jgi:hypothetical protein